MKFYKIILILIVFFKTGNVLSDENIFNVNNVEIIKKNVSSNEDLANQAIIKGFNELIEKILLNDDKNKISNLSLNQVKNLVSYYQVISSNENSDNNNKIKFNIFFDKDKLHNLFYSRGILYSEINNKEIFILPIFIKNEIVHLYNKIFL